MTHFICKDFILLILLLLCSSLNKLSIKLHMGIYNEIHAIMVLCHRNEEPWGLDGVDVLLLWPSSEPSFSYWVG